MCVTWKMQGKNIRYKFASYKLEQLVSRVITKKQLLFYCLICQNNAFLNYA